MPSQLDTIAGRYVLESEISRGGMATVWQARDSVLARPVAIKILHAHLSEDESFLERFRREALAAARLSHANIVSIYDTGTEPSDGGEVHFIVMERCGGGTLGDLLAAEGSLAPDRVASIGQTICDALGYAHQQGIVHRDVKPANVLFADDGLLKVADFGIAKAAFTKSDITTTGSILGTVTYLSPEQSQGQDPDARSDLYGLGIVLYELLVGRPPFAGETQIATAMMHVKEPPPAPRSIKAGVPRPLEAAILKALEKDPDRRYSSAEEMAAALGGTGGGTRIAPAVVPRTTTSPASAPAPAGDTRWIVRVVVAIVVTVALALLAASLVDQERDTADEARSTPGAQGNATAGVRVAEVTDFDPHGGDGEHPEEAANAADGSPSTVWTTQTYSASLEAQGKPGVGLVFDLGDDAAEIVEVRVTGSPGMDVELRSSDDLGAVETDFEERAAEQATPERFTFEIEPTSARYWLLWITNLSGSGGGTASVAEVEFVSE